MKRKIFDNIITSTWTNYSYIVNVLLDEKTGKWEQITGQEIKHKKGKQIYDAIVILHGRHIKVK